MNLGKGLTSGKSAGASRNCVLQRREQVAGIGSRRQVEDDGVDELDATSGSWQRGVRPLITAQECALQPNGRRIGANGKAIHGAFGSHRDACRLKRKRLRVFFRPPSRWIVRLDEPRHILDLDGTL